MKTEDLETETASLSVRSHLVASIPLLALAAIAAWIVLARPSAHAAPAPEQVSIATSAR